MAQITGLMEKQKALKDINEKLKSIVPLNLFLQTPNLSNEYVISIEGVKALMLCEDKTTIDNFVKAYKAKIVNEINSLAENHSITLDDEDKNIMHDLFVPETQNKRKSTGSKTVIN